MRFQPYISEMPVSKLACFYRTFDFQHQHSSNRKYFCREEKLFWLVLFKMFPEILKELRSLRSFSSLGVFPLLII